MFELPQLSYSLNELEPYISQKTMEFHYYKHHQTYINNLNELIAGTEFENMELEKIIQLTADDEKQKPIFNNAAQVWNHNFFWKVLSPVAKHEPDGKLLEDIKRDFGSFENLKVQFKDAAVKQFGSGWAWIVRNPDGHLSIMKTSNADNPVAHGLQAIMTIDVWEHAYYLDYQNRRADFVQTVIENLIDWKE